LSQPRSNSQAGGSSWRAALERIPTVLGRLSYMAGLRDPVSNSYFHPLLSRTHGAEEATRELRHFHYQVFSEWLALGLADQKSDLSEFLAAEGLRPEELRVRDLIPPQARDVEKQLYLADLKTLLKLVKSEWGATSPEE
jgi:hypothetical protein